MRDCAAREYGCSCSSGECQIEKRRNDSEATLRTIIAKQTAYPVLSVFAFGLLVAVFVGGALTLDNHFKREALRNQEQNVSWR